MKKHTLLLVWIILLSRVLIAQENSTGTIEITPNIGYTSTFLNGDEIDDLGSRNSFQFSVFGDYYFNKRWSIKLGLSYFSMGATIPIARLNLDYLNIPLNANWHFGKAKSWNLYFGIAPGFLLNGKMNGEDVKDFYKPFQLAISYGLGYKIKISNNFSILIDGYGLIGLSNIIKDPDGFTRLNAGGSVNLGGVFKL